MTVVEQALAPVDAGAEDQQAALAVPGGRPLFGVAVGDVEMLVLEALTDLTRDLVGDCLEAELVAAGSGAGWERQ